MIRQQPIGADAVATKGWWRAYKWLLLRRISQLTVVALFLLGPLAGIWWLQGNLSASLVLDTLVLTDPYLLLQSLFAGHWPLLTAWLGAGIVLLFYFVLGGRVYCSWVCPMNIITDSAHWLRRRLGISGAGMGFKRQTRFWIMGMTLVTALVSGSIAWELINPVSLLHRGILFGMGVAWLVVLAIFLFDVFIARHGWCGHLCPVGAFYSVLGHKSVPRVSASRRSECNDCMDCYGVCPEPQVISPALRGEAQGPLILSPQCTNCGRCIDVCSKNVFHFSTRFNRTMETSL